MERETLLAHRDLWTRETKPERRDLSRLTPAERQVYDDLRDHRLGTALRLEQERIRFGWVECALEGLLRATNG